MPNTKSGTSDEDLAKQREKLDKLRAQLAEAEQERLEKEAGQTNEILAAQLGAEEERLLSQLAAGKAQAKATSAKDSSSPLAQARENMKNAEAQRQAVEDANQAAAEAAKNQES